MNIEGLHLEALRPIIPFPMATKLAVLCIVFVVISVGYYFLMWMPLQDEIESLNASVEQQRVMLKKNQNLARNIPQKKKEYKLLQKQLKIALNMLPKQSQIPDLLEGVTWAGKDSGLSFSTFKPGNESIKSIYAEVPVSLSVSGTYRQFLTFLKRVGEMPRIVDVKDLSFTVVDGQKLSIEGQAVTYRFVDEANKEKGKK